jgi:hypothetical protein
VTANSSSRYLVLKGADVSQFKEVLVGGLFDHHSTRLGATILMCYKLSFYDHYITDFSFDNFDNFDMSKLRHFDMFNFDISTLGCRILAGNFSNDH